MNPLPLLCACIMALPCLAAELRPGAPVEIQPFNPDKWKEHQISTRMVPWVGQRVVFLTATSAMLRLRREHGGDAWVRRFFQHLATAPDVEARDEAGSLAQARNWFLCACLAAQADLSPDFCDRWRMTLPPATRQALATFPWGPGATLDSLNKHLPVDP